MDRKEENSDDIEPKYVFEDMADDMKTLAKSLALSAYSTTNIYIYIYIKYIYTHIINLFISLFLV